MSLPIKSFLLGIYSPIEIRIEKIEIFLKTNDNWEFFDYTSFDYKSKLIKSITDNLIFKMQLKQNPDINNTYLNRTISYIVDNIMIDIKDITIIFEDIFSHKTKNIFCGIKIETISINNINSDKVNTYTKVEPGSLGTNKKFSINKFSLFLIPTATKTKKISFDYYSSLSDYGHNFIRDHSTLFTDTPKSSSHEINLKDYYIINPTSINVSIYHTSSYIISIELKEFEIKITSAQFVSVIALIRFIDNYRIYYGNCYSLRKLNFYKPKEKNIYFLKHYFKGVLNLIKEKKYGVEMFSLSKDIDYYKKIFIEKYKVYYKTLQLDDDLKEIICYIDMELLEKWIKEDLNNILVYVNASQGGFFFGLFSYFYSSVVTNMNSTSKIDLKDKIPFEMNLTVKLNYFAFCISTKKTDNNTENARLVLRNNYFDMKISNLNDNVCKIISNIEMFKIEYLNRINTSEFKTEVVYKEKPSYKLLKNNEKISNSIEMLFDNDKMNINLTSHNIVYNQNMINFLFAFFTIKNLDRFAKRISSLYNDSRKLDEDDKDNKPIEIDLKVDNQKIIFPFKSSNERLTLNSGILSLFAKKNGEINVLVKDINLHFLQQDIIESFCCNITLQPLPNKVINLQINEIVINLSKISIEKLLLSYREIFTLLSYKDLWMMKIKEKLLIFDNHKIRGFILYLNQFTGKWEQYFSYLSGGYIYLFVSSNQDELIMIPLTQSRIASIEKKNDNLYSCTIIAQDGRKYCIGLMGEKTMNEWKTNIEQRIEEIRVSSFCSFNYNEEESATEERKSEIQQFIKNKSSLFTLKNFMNTVQILSDFIVNKALSKYNDFIVQTNVKSIEILFTIENGSKLNGKIKDISISFLTNDVISNVYLSIGDLNITNNNSIHLVHFDNKNNDQCLISSSFSFYNDKAYELLKIEQYKQFLPLICDNKDLIEYISTTMTKISIELNMRANVLFVYEPTSAEFISSMAKEIATLVANSTTTVVKAVENIGANGGRNELSTMRCVFNTNGISISLINKKTYICLFRINVDKISLEHFSHRKSNVTIGSIGLLYNQISLANAQLGKIVYESKNNITDLDVKILGNIDITYYHHPIMKLVDYVLHDILEVIINSKNGIVPKKIVEEKPVTKITITPGNNLYVMNSTVKTNKVNLKIIDPDNENIWYQMKVGFIELKNSKDVFVDNLSIYSWDEFEILKSDVGFSSDFIVTDLIINNVGIKIRKEDYDNIFSIVQGISMSVIKEKSMREETKPETTITDIFLSVVNIKVKRFSVMLLEEKRKLIGIDINGIESSLTNYNNKFISVIKINSLLIDNEKSIIFSSYNTSNRNLLYFSFTNDNINLSNTFDININSFYCNLLYEMSFDIIHFFNFESSRHCNNIKDASIDIHNNGIIQTTKANIFINSPYIYFTPKESNTSLALQLSIFFTLESSDENSSKASTDMKYQMKLQNVSLFTFPSQNDGSLNIENVNKKYILYPTSLSINSQTTSSISFIEQIPTQSISVYLNSKHIDISFSFQDIQFLTVLSKELLSFYQSYNDREIMMNNSISLPVEDCISPMKQKIIYDLIFSLSKINLSLTYQKNNILNGSLSNIQILLGKKDTEFMKIESNVNLSYLNMKLIKTEPFLEDTHFCVNYSKDHKKEVSFGVDVYEDININITEEVLHTIKEVYSTIKGDKENEFMSSSTNVIYNYSGLDIYINNNEKECIPNGKMYDFDNSFIETIGFKPLSENGNQQYYKIDDIKKDKKIWIKIGGKNHEIFYYEEISQLKKKVVLYSQFVIQSQCDKNVIINGNKILHMNEILGITDTSISIVSNYNYQNINEVNLNNIKNLSSYRLEGMMINIDRIVVNKETIYKFNILPNVIIQNCIDLPIAFHLNETNEDIVVNQNSKSHMYFNANLIYNFYIKFQHKSFNFTSDTIKLKPNANENSIKIKFPGESFVIKLNHILIKDVLYYFIYFDYVIINNTNYDIYPKEAKIELQTKINSNVRYYPTENFSMINLVLNAGNDNIIPLPDIIIDKKNYAYFNQFSLLLNKDTNSHINILIQRHLRYYQFTKIKKIDMLVISIINNEEDKRSSSSKSLSFSNKIKKVSQLSLNLSSINLSIIPTNKYRTELAIINVSNTRLGYKREVYENEEVYKSIDFKVGSIQIDNMEDNAVYKVVLCPNEDTEDDYYSNNSKNKLTSTFIYFSARYKQGAGAYYQYSFDKMIFVIRSFNIFLDSEFAADVTSFIFKMQKNLSAGSFYISSVPQAISSLSSISRSLRKEKPIYISSINTSPIAITFSYKNISNRLFDVLNLRSSIIQNIIDLFATTTHINISLNSLEMNSVSGDMKDIFDKIQDYHYYKLIGQCIKLLFSIDILGNPLGLVERLGKGVKDFIYFPIAGAAGGPSKFIFGSYSGAKSLLSHAVGGVFDSAHRITAGLGKGILKLTDADDYIKSKNMVLQNFANLKIGRLNTAMSLVGVGVEYGIRDFVWFPYMYYNKKGVLYLPKGSIMGLTSIVVKPMSGVLDFMSFFSNQMAKSVLVDYDVKARFKHIRDKRKIWNEKNK